MVPELMVSNFKESLSFYTEILGFKVAFSRKNPNFAYLELEGAQVMLEEVYDDYWETGELTRPFGRGVNFQITLKNIEEIYSRLVEIKHPFYRDKKESWYRENDILTGQKEFLIQDPDGYLLRFAQHTRDKPINE